MTRNTLLVSIENAILAMQAGLINVEAIQVSFNDYLFISHAARHIEPDRHTVLKKIGELPEIYILGVRVLPNPEEAEKRIEDFKEIKSILNEPQKSSS